MHQFTLQSRRTAASLLAAGVILFATFGLVLRTGDAAQALTNCTVSDYALDSEELAFLQLINDYRDDNGLDGLAVSENLNRAASWLSVDMPENRTFSHVDSLSRSPYTRAKQCGYPTGAAENIAAGGSMDTAQEAFDAWRRSSGHNANMLNGSYVMIGVARHYDADAPYRWYWVTNFGLVDDGTSVGAGSTNPTATPTNTPTQTATNTPTQAPTATPTQQPPTATATPTQQPPTATPTQQPPTATPTQQPPTATPTPDQAPVAAAMQSPQEGATLPGASATFAWSTGQQAREYFLYVGTNRGTNDIAGGSTGTATSRSVSGIPTDGSAVWARLWTRFDSGWTYVDYSYRAATTVDNGSTIALEGAELTSPTPGSTLPMFRATFAWERVTGAQRYMLSFGTSPGSSNLGTFDAGTSGSITLSGLPRDGRTVYVRLSTQFATGWAHNDYQYRAWSWYR